MRSIHGEQINNYRVVETLGTGSFGIVYRAVHLHQPNLSVAIRVLPTRLAQNSTFIATLTEIHEKRRRLSTQNVVGIRDLVPHGDLQLLIKDFIEGETLRVCRERGARHWTEGIPEMGQQLLLGAVEGHSQGLIHGNLNDTNVFMAASDVIDIRIDGMGLLQAAWTSNIFDVETDLTTLAPELLDKKSLSPRVDIYSIGLVLWSMLAGRKGCDHTTVDEILKWHQGPPLPDVRSLDENIPAPLAQCIAQFSTRTPRARPQDATQALRIWQKKVMQLCPDPPVLFESTNPSIPNIMDDLTETAGLRGSDDLLPPDDPTQEADSISLEPEPTEVTAATESIEVTEAIAVIDTPSPSTQKAQKTKHVGRPRLPWEAKGTGLRKQLWRPIVAASALGLVFLGVAGGFYKTGQHEEVVQKQAQTTNDKRPKRDGATIYGIYCQSCHGDDGLGRKGIYPPLAGSDWVLGDPNMNIALVLHGLQGPIRVNGKKYNRSMGPYRDALNNWEVAGVVSYIRSSWGNKASKVSSKDVHRVRRSGTPNQLLTKESFVVE